MEITFEWMSIDVEPYYNEQILSKRFVINKSLKIKYIRL